MCTCSWNTINTDLWYTDYTQVHAIHMCNMCTWQCMHSWWGGNTLCNAYTQMTQMFTSIYQRHVVQMRCTMEMENKFEQCVLAMLGLALFFMEAASTTTSTLPHAHQTSKRNETPGFRPNLPQASFYTIFEMLTNTVAVLH